MSTFTQAHLTAIEEAIAGGYLKVRYDDKEVTYQDMNALLKARNMIASSLQEGPARSPLRLVTVTTARDYE
jgi:hypothetical protein